MIGRLTDTDQAVVARHAVIDNTCVLECRLGKIRRDMAGRAILGRRQVGYELADTDDVVVARGTIADDTGVIKYATGECTGCVTGSAIFDCRHMVARLAKRAGPVVAGIAADRCHQVTGVVDKCPDKAIDIMTRAAVCSSCRMIEGLAGCRGSVVAGGAGLRHRVEKRVIENTARVECADAMARQAVHIRLGMVLCFPGRVDAIVAGDAITRNGAVVDVRG